MFHRISDGFSGFLKLWWRRKPLVRDYTPKNAYAIQKQACQKFSIREQSFTPPYLLIAASLNTENLPVFEASVYYLCTIAANKPAHKQSIIEILNSYLEENQENQAKSEYIKNEMKNFNLI